MTCGNTILWHHFSNLWLAAGWLDTLEVPESYDDLYMLVNRIINYFAANPAKENPALGVTAAHAQSLATAMQSSDNAYLAGEVASMTWTRAGGGSGSTCPAPRRCPRAQAVVAFPLTGARLQISCDPSVGATSYRFFVQRPILDPVPTPVGTSTEPLLIADAPTPGQEYLVYVSATNDGAESSSAFRRR